MLLELVVAATPRSAERMDRVKPVALLAQPVRLAVHHHDMSLAVVWADFPLPEVLPVLRQVDAAAIDPARFSGCHLSGRGVSLENYRCAGRMNVPSDSPNEIQRLPKTQNDSAGVPCDVHKFYLLNVVPHLNVGSFIF